MHTFIALDLETTGLDTKTDTIIEIAAIQFQISSENGIFTPINISERSMLINPGIPLSEEVMLITHISDEMLEKKPHWKEVQEKAREFIGTDTVILGHNVLFDVAMLQSHGINLENHTIIDTFELSEILSQKAESLNLWFLGDFYGIEKRGVEHRALTDTWIATDLFLKYLEVIKNLSDTEKSILFHGKNKDTNGFLRIIESLTGKTSTSIPEDFFKKTETKQFEWSGEIKMREIDQNSDIVSLSWTKDDEMCLIEETLQKHSKIEIFCQTRNTAGFLRKKCTAQGISSIIQRSSREFLASDSIWRELDNPKTVERKYLIFLIKMLFWLQNTEHGTLEELKYYGQEYDFLENFRLEPDETNCFREAYEQKERAIPVLITPISNKMQRSNRFGLFKDIILLEEPLRRMSAEHVSFKKLANSIRTFDLETTDELITYLNLIESLYLAVPNRPTGENPNPPGKFGETYFFAQRDLWHRHAKWLILANRQLQDAFTVWRENAFSLEWNREEKIRLQKIEYTVRFILSFHTVKCEEKGVILKILDEETTLTFLDTNIPNREMFFKNSICYGYALDEKTSKNFMETAFALDVSGHMRAVPGNQATKFISIEHVAPKKKVLILTTNLKDIRALGESFSEYGTVFMQGISGGKSKIIHYFERSEDEHTFLIGLIDSWKDAFGLFGKIDQIIIAKIPFDPPTDPGFLAKTQNLENAFESYTKPVVLARLNTLIGNICENFPNTEIICADSRIHLSRWGQFIKANLL